MHNQLNHLFIEATWNLHNYVINVGVCAGTLPFIPLKALDQIQNSYNKENILYKA